jgi:hypothetical protein
VRGSVVVLGFLRVSLPGFGFVVVVGVFFVVLACCHAKGGSKQKNGQHDCDHSIDFFHNDIPFGFVLLIAVSFPKKQIGTA